MALKKAGVFLVAENYNDYMQKLRNIEKGHKEAFQGAADSARKIKPATEQAKQGVESLSATFLRLGNIVKASVIGFLAIAALKLRQFFAASTEVALRNETLKVSLDEIGKAVGYTQKQIDYAIESLREQGITTSAAEKALMRMARANIEWSEAAKLAAIAQGSAITAGMTSSEAFERLVTGIQKREPELLDELGITLRRGEAYKRLAAELGKNADELTEQEQMQAILNEVYRQSGAVLGVYDAAMTTAGKQQTTIIRLIEETQNNLGQMGLAFKSAGTTMEMDFWKGAQKATLGLKGWAEIAGFTVDALLAIDEQTGKSALSLETFGDTMGRFAHNLARVFLDVSAFVGPALARTSDLIGEFLSRTGAALEKYAQKDFRGAALEMAKFGQEAAALQGRVAEDAAKQQQKYREQFKLVFEDFDKLSEKEETNLAREKSAADTQVELLQKQKEALEAQLGVVQRAEQIYKSFRESVRKENESFGKQQQQLDKQLNDRRAQLEKRTQKSLIQLAVDAQKQRAQILKDAGRAEEERQRNLHRTLEEQERQFQLSQRQNLARFQLEERRLRASGDILGLQRLREDRDLAQQEAQQGFQDQQRQTIENAQEEQRKEQEALQERLKELGVSVEERRQEILASYDEELNDLIAANAEQQAALVQAHNERLDEIVQARNEQIRELGATLKDEAKLTQEGMDELARIFTTVFGDEGSGVILIQGWAERAQDAMGQAIEGMKAQLEDLDAQISALGSGEGGASADATEAARAARASSRRPSRSRRRGMRQGGIGVVEGPMTFDVEPGVREAVMFVPLGRPSTLAVNVSGGVDVRGAEGASPGVVDNAVAEIITAMRVAAERFARHG